MINNKFLQLLQKEIFVFMTSKKYSWLKTICRFLGELLFIISFLFFFNFCPCFIVLYYFFSFFYRENLKIWYYYCNLSLVRKFCFEFHLNYLVIKNSWKKWSKLFIGIAYIDYYFGHLYDVDNLFNFHKNLNGCFSFYFDKKIHTIWFFFNIFKEIYIFLLFLPQ